MTQIECIHRVHISKSNQNLYKFHIQIFWVGCLTYDRSRISSTLIILTKHGGQQLIQIKTNY